MAKFRPRLHRLALELTPENFLGNVSFSEAIVRDPEVLEQLLEKKEKAILEKTKSINLRACSSLKNSVVDSLIPLCPGKNTFQMENCTVKFQ